MRPHPQVTAFRLVLDAVMLWAAAVRRERALKEEIHAKLNELAELQSLARRCEGETLVHREGDRFVEERCDGHILAALRAYRHAGSRVTAAARRHAVLDGLTDGERAWDAFDMLPEEVQAAEWASVTIP